MSGRTVVFDADATSERRFAPWPVKAASVQTAFTMGVVYIWDAFLPMGPLYTVAQILLAGNYTRTVFNLMTSAVTKVVLLDGGKQVEFTFGRTGGKTTTVNIRDIEKQEHEKTLVETYEESSMFPLKAGGVTYYLHGQGQECVKNGELLRAIINGQSIKM